MINMAIGPLHHHLYEILHEVPHWPTEQPEWLQYSRQKETKHTDKEQIQKFEAWLYDLKSMNPGLSISAAQWSRVIEKIATDRKWYAKDKVFFSLGRRPLGQQACRKPGV